MSIKFDKRNYRKHNDANKRKIKKSLEECGAGRSVLVDADDCLIAGNGVYEQASALGIPTRVIETDGTELVVVKRTDLQTGDDKRKLLALADNATSDNVEWEFENISLDADVLNAVEWDIVIPEYEELPNVDEMFNETTEESIRNVVGKSTGRFQVTFLFPASASAVIDYIKTNGKDYITQKIIEICQDAEVK